MRLPSTCNINKHFILYPSVTRFSALLMKFSCIVCNFAPAALAIAQDLYKERKIIFLLSYYYDSICIILGQRENQAEKKTLRNGLRYWEIYEGI